MTENEAKIFIQNAMEQSKKVLAELLLISPKVFAVRKKSLGEYYSNLENCKKEIESCEVAIRALEDVQKYRALGTPEKISRKLKELEKISGGAVSATVRKDECFEIVKECRPQTNADRIRSMTDEELAEFLPIASNFICQPTEECIRNTVMNHCGECERTEECAMKWLRAESEG